MARNSESGNTVLRLWLLLHRVRDGIVLCEDSIFGKYGLTTEQFVSACGCEIARWFSKAK